MTGKQFELLAKKVIYEAEETTLHENVELTIGISNHRKPHKFDLGNKDLKIVVECKFHSWTQSGNSPSAKMAIWNEAMYYFSLVPKDYRKILFVRSHWNEKQQLTLAKYYIKTYLHLIPEDLEIWEYDLESGISTRAVWPFSN